MIILSPGEQDDTGKVHGMGMNIFFFTRYPPDDGYESFSSYWFARDLAAAGHRLAVIRAGSGAVAPARPEEDERHLPGHENISVFQAGEAEFSYQGRRVQDHSLKLANSALALSRHFKATLMLTSNVFPSGLAGYYTGLVTGIPRIMRIDSPDESKRAFQSGLIRRVLEEACRIEITDSQRKWFSGLGIQEQRFISREGLINPYFFDARTPAFDFSSCGVVRGEEKPLYTLLSDPAPPKGISYLIRVLSLMKNKNFNLCVQLDLADQALCRDVLELIEEKKMQNQVIIIPPQPPWHFASLMSASTALICPGFFQERQSMTVPFLYEAICCGKCVIFARDWYEKSMFTSLREGEEILLFDLASELRAHLESLACEPEMAGRIGARAREKILEGWNFARNFASLCTIYEECSIHAPGHR